MKSFTNHPEPAPLLPASIKQLHAGQSIDVQVGGCPVTISRPKPVGGELPEDYPPVVLDDLTPGANPWLD